MINAEQLNAIKERAAKATPGPWRSAGLYGVRTQNDAALSIPLRPEDATFIASCREDVPALVAEVERLQELLKHSLETQVKYTIALSKISCDSQYLNVATSSKGGEKLIEIARDALK